MPRELDASSRPITRHTIRHASAEFTTQMIPTLEAAVEHPDMTEDLARVLSTWMVELRILLDVLNKHPTETYPTIGNVRIKTIGTNQDG